MSNTTEFWHDPALPHVESRRACHSRACYRAHSHATYSVGAVDAGTSVFSGAPGGTRQLQRGAVVAVPAGQVHACNPLPGKAWSYQMLHVDAAWLAALRTEDRPPGADAPAELIRIHQDRACYQRYCALNALLFSPADPAMKDAALVAFFHDLDHAGGEPVAGPVVDAGLRRQLAPVMDALRQDLLHTPSLAELALLAGLSRFQLIRAFRRVTGLTPHAWHMDQRIQQARRELRGGQPLATLAHALGFADQSHFQRVFKAHTATTPGHYRG